MFNGRRFLRELHLTPVEVEIIDRCSSGEPLNDFELAMMDALDARISGLIADWRGVDD